MKIGIGVCSYKRPDLATKTCQEILNTIDRGVHEYQTICSVDDMNIQGYEWVKDNFGLIYEQNAGIPVNKNRIIKYLQNNDVIFLAEDDIGFNKPGWVELYLTAIKETKFEHFNYIVENYRKQVHKIIKYPSISLGFCGGHLSGVLMVMTKNCIQKVGGMDESYKVYGFEHADYSRRCAMAGLYPIENMHVMETSPYIEQWNVPSCVPDDTKNKFIEYNRRIWMNNKRKVFCPFNHVTYRS